MGAVVPVGRNPSSNLALLVGSVESLKKKFGAVAVTAPAATLRDGVPAKPLVPSLYWTSPGFPPDGLPPPPPPPLNPLIPLNPENPDRLENPLKPLWLENPLKPLSPAPE